MIALEMIDMSPGAEFARGVLLADARYGDKSMFRDHLDELKMPYAVAIRKHAGVRRVHRVGGARRVSEEITVEDLAFALASSGVRMVTWREATKATMSQLSRQLPVPSLRAVRRGVRLDGLG